MFAITFFPWLGYTVAMKMIIRCLFTFGVCFALAVPLYACEGAAGKAGQSVTVAAGVASKTAASRSEAMSRKAKQPVKKQTGKHTAAQTQASQNDQAHQEGKRSANVASVDFHVLKERLKNTDAIGFFTKLAIRNDILDLMDKIKTYRKHAMLNEKRAEIRRSFDGLLLKIIALLKDDPKLSRDLYVGRESIWESLLEVKA